MDRILFEKPNIALLKKEGYECFDMHVHSEHSPDSDSKVIDIIKRAEQLGISVAITDHNKIQGSLEAYKINKKIIIPGIEARSKEGLDILFYFYKIDELKNFYENVIKPNKKRLGGSKLSAIELIEKSKPYNSISCIAHPYRPYPKKIINATIRNKNTRSIFNKIKIFEVINSKNFRIFNNQAIKNDKKKNKGIIGGSDSHNIRKIGSTVTCTKNKKNTIAHVLDEIASNNVIVVGKERSPIFDLIESSIVMIKKII